jgi:hypothetical protein
MGEAIAAMQKSMNAAKEGYIVEDSVDILVKKLESQGKRVKIIEEEDVDENDSNDQGTKSAKKGASKKKRPIQ